MDFGGLLVLGVIWLLFNLIGQGKGRPPHGRSPPMPPEPRPRERPDPPSGKGAGWSGCSGSWSGASRDVAERPSRPVRPGCPAPRSVEEEDVEERGSLEEPERVVSLETDVPPPRARGVRPGRRGRSDRAAADRGGRGAETARSARRTTQAFDAQIRQEPADTRRSGGYTPAQLREAIVWREILGPPVSLSGEDERRFSRARQ